MSDIITALKRLERAGSEDSRETAKLLHAAELFSAHISSLLPPEANNTDGAFPLPRYYAVYCETLMMSSDKGGVIVYDNRRAAEDFARDIADGWLTELSDWLEARTAGSAEAGATLRRAAECFATR